MSIGQLPSTGHGAGNRKKSVVRMRVIGPLPSTDHSTDHIENTSPNTFSIFFVVARAMSSCIVGGFSRMTQLHGVS